MLVDIMQFLKINIISSLDKEDFNYIKCFDNINIKSNKSFDLTINFFDFYSTDKIELYFLLCQENINIKIYSSLDFIVWSEIKCDKSVDSLKHTFKFLKDVQFKFLKLVFDVDNLTVLNKMSMFSNIHIKNVNDIISFKSLKDHTKRLPSIFNESDLNNIYLDLLKIKTDPYNKIKTKIVEFVGG